MSTTRDLETIFVISPRKAWTKRGLLPT